jgi:thiopeptide-type bacteriocin biosynthesis protein
VHHPTTTPPAADRRTDWSAWHLHLASTAATLHDRVLTDVAVPVAARFPDRPWFFIRYWQAGPHLRLRIGDLTEAERGRAEAELTERLAAVGRLEDGEAPVEAEDYRQEARRLAAAGDRTDGAVTETLLPPGVHRAEYRPEDERYGGRALMPAAESLFRLSSELAVAIVRGSSSPRARMVAALRATHAAGQALGGTGEASAFYSLGTDAWRSMVGSGFGATAEQLDAWCAADAADARAAELLTAAGHGPYTDWHDALAEHAGLVRQRSELHPGRVLFSHVHMLHNRIGLSLVDEMRTYARLRRLFPAPTPQEQR